MAEAHGFPKRDRCPMTILRSDRPGQFDHDAAVLVHFYPMYREHGRLWRAGEIGEQPVNFTDAMRAIDSTAKEVERQHHDKLMEDAKRRR